VGVLPEAAEVPPTLTRICRAPTLPSAGPKRL
jgi:hypothetical protein